MKQPDAPRSRHKNKGDRDFAVADLWKSFPIMIAQALEMFVTAEDLPRLFYNDHVYCFILFQFVVYFFLYLFFFIF